MDQERIGVGDLIEIHALEVIWFAKFPEERDSGSGLKEDDQVGKGGLTTQVQTIHGVFDVQRMLRLGAGERVVGLVVGTGIRLDQERGPVSWFRVLVGEDQVTVDPGSPWHGGAYHLMPGYVIRRVQKSSHRKEEGDSHHDHRESLGES